MVDVVVKRSEVEEVVDATEAVWARRAESSRVRRFTCGEEGEVSGILTCACICMSEDRLGSNVNVQCFLALSRVRDVILLR